MLERYLQLAHLTSTVSVYSFATRLLVPKPRFVYAAIFNELSDSGDVNPLVHFENKSYERSKLGHTLCLSCKEAPLQRCTNSLSALLKLQLSRCNLDRFLSRSHSR